LYPARGDSNRKGREGGFGVKKKVGRRRTGLQPEPRKRPQQKRRKTFETTKVVPHVFLVHKKICNA